VEVTCTLPRGRNVGDDVALAANVETKKAECTLAVVETFAVAARVLAFLKLGVWAKLDIEFFKKLQECDCG
jgi:hypothetical protein